jgi:type IV pilus assembly protein PilZ
MPEATQPPPSDDAPPESEGSGGSQKRREARAAITLKVDYRRLNSFFADYTKNISKGGTFIRTSKPLKVGTEFVFVLSLPTINEQLQLNGEVIWVVTDAEATEEQPSGMGIKFRFENDVDRQKVADFVERLMVDALGEHISQRLLAKK